MLNPNLTPEATKEWLDLLGDKTRLALQNMTEGEPWVLDALNEDDGHDESEGKAKVLRELSKLLTEIGADQEIDDDDLNDVRVIVAYLSAARRMQVFQALQSSTAFDSGVRLLQKSQANTQPSNRSQEEIFGNKDIEEAARTILTDTVLHMLRHSSLATLFSSDRVARIARIAREERNTERSN